jgi:EmrB/QacA subfamily drug resistance transporter
LSHHEVRSVITGLMLAILLGALDQTIVSVSLPSISAQLHGFEIVAWVVAGYLVASTVITPIYGKLADLYGARALLSFAIVLFLVASVVCALAQTMPQLIAGRILQGLGGGGLISLAQAIIPQVVSLRERGRYQGYLSGVYAFASVAGPVVGGFLTHYLSWRWVFWINLPLGAAAFVVSRRALARLPVPGRKPQIDYAGALLLATGLTALLIAVTRVGQGISWHAPSTLSLVGVAVAILGACLWHERTAREPILPLTLFRIKTVTLCSAIVFIAFFQLIPLVALMPLRLEMLAGVSAGAVGLRLVPLTLGIPIGAYMAGTLMSWTGRYKPWQLIGATLVPAAIFALAAAGSHDLMWIAVCMAVIGFSIGMQLPTALVAAQNAIPVENLGVGTASIAFFRSLGGAVGVACLSAILLALLRDHVSTLVVALPGGETLRELIVRTLTTADAATRGQLLEAAEDAFRKVLYISASISMISVALAAMMPEQPLRGRVSSVAQEMGGRI